MSSVSLRYYAKNDTYYIRIQGEEYVRLDKKLRRLVSHLKREQNLANAAKLAAQRRNLIKQRRKAVRYVAVEASDIPEDAKCSPIYELTGEIITVSPERYAQLLTRLQITKLPEE
jgi:chaperonin cofactor prefoldin